MYYMGIEKRDSFEFHYPGTLLRSFGCFAVCQWSLLYLVCVNKKGEGVSCCHNLLLELKKQVQQRNRFLKELLITFRILAFVQKSTLSGLLPCQFLVELVASQIHQTVLLVVVICIAGNIDLSSSHLPLDVFYTLT